MKPLRVLLVDDHALVRAGFRALLREMGLEIVAETGHGRDVLEQVAEHTPDIVLMDIAMPDVNGLEVTARLKERFPDVRVVILSMHANIEYVRRALQAGAAGYLLKNAKAAELETALSAVAQGAIYLSPDVASIVAADLGGQDAPGGRWQPALTPREHAVVRLVAAGRTNKEIAERLAISVRTVERHRSAIMRKLGLRHQAELVSYAVRQGLLEPGSGAP